MFCIERIQEDGGMQIKRGYSPSLEVGTGPNSIQSFINSSSKLLDLIRRQYLH